LLLIVGLFFFSRANAARSAEATATAEAIALLNAQTATAAADAEEIAVAEATLAADTQASANAAATAEAEELQRPTLTAQAALDIANTATAAAEQGQEIVGGILATFEAATAEASTAEALIAETATAEFAASITDTPVPTETPTAGPPTAIPPTETPTGTPTPDRPQVSGKLAFPVDNGAGAYDVFIVSLPDGEQLGKINGARQPNFRLDGVTMLVNGQGGSFGENIFEASGTGAIQKPVSGSPTDQHPFYKPDGTTLAYANEQLAFGSEGYNRYLFVQCGLIPPQQDSGPCADIAGLGVLIPAGQIGDILGTNPVWTASDMIAYRGCDTWAGGTGGSCGIYRVGSWATKRFSSGENPRKIVDGGNTIPTDSKAGLIAYQSREGDWEAFIVPETGGNSTNLSNSPNSQDGLPTISPDGKSVIFASNREGGWAVYVVSSSGGAVTKLFDFPKSNPWATGDRDWSNERMSWAP
jgi:hypothetical protein